jgi:SNW domain-containing protein 1
MTSIAAGLNKVLPAPKHAAEDDGSAARPTSRILGNADVERQQLVLKVGFYLALTGRC